MSKNSTTRTHKPRRGALLLEFTIVVPILLFFILAFIQLAIFWATQLSLQAGATRGVALASKTDGIQVDIREFPPNFTCIPGSGNSLSDFQRQQYIQFLKARERAIAEALHIPSVNLVRPSRDGSGWVTEGRHFHALRIESYHGCPPPEGQSAPPYYFDAALILPGQRIQRREPDESGEYYIQHPTCPFDDTLNNCPNGSLTTLYRTHPLAVVMESNFEWFFPLIPKTRVRAMALAFRERTFSRAVPEYVNPPQLPTATTTPLPTPSRTMTPTITATRTITPTGTPSATPTETGTATVTATPSITGTPTISPTPSITPTITLTPTTTATATITLTPTITGTATQTGTATASATASATGTSTGTPTNSPTSTNSPTPTVTATTTRTATITVSPTITATPTITLSPTISATPTITATSTRTGTPTGTGTATGTATQTRTPTVTGTPTTTATITATATTTRTPTITSSPTATSTSTATNTPAIPPTVDQGQGE